MAYVALLAEGVDRNFFENGLFAQVCESPSSRRAWIEIKRIKKSYGNLDVALLAEGVDRNRDQNVDNPAINVALLAEGVDRNQTFTPPL